MGDAVRNECQFVLVRSQKSPQWDWDLTNAADQYIVRKPGP